MHTTGIWYVRRLDSSVGVLHLEGEAGEVLLRVGNTRSRALAWLAAANRAAATRCVGAWLTFLICVSIAWFA